MPLVGDWVTRERRPDAHSVGISLFVVVLLILVAAYIPNLFFRYAFADDYAYLAIHGFRPINPYFLADGRPLGGFLAVLLFTAFDSISADAWLRLLALVQLVIALILVYRAAMSAGLDSSWAAFLAIFFAASPSVQNWVIWGVTAWQMPALLLALVSTAAWRRVVDKWGMISALNCAALFALSFAAMLIYQPFAMAAWPFVFLECVIGVRRFALRRMMLGGVIYGLMLLCYFVFFKYVLITFVPPDGPHGRVVAIGLGELLAKIVWFLTGPLRTSFTPLSVHGVPEISILLAVLSLVALLYFQRADWWRAVLICVLGSITIVICHLPALAAPEPTGIRTEVSLALAVDTLIVLAAVMLDRISGISPAKRAAVVLAACVVMSIWASYKILTIAVWPHALEIALIEREFEKVSFAPERPIVLVGRPYGASVTGRSCDNVANMGCASLSMQFAAPNMLRLWMRERNVDFAQYTILFLSSPSNAVAVSFEASRTTSVPVPKNAMFIDIGAAVLGDH